MFIAKFSRVVSIITLVTFLFMPQYGYSLPQDGNVVSGQATIEVDGTTMDVNQSTNKMIANWRSFSIGQPETVNFYQPSRSSVALNRVTGVDPSSIMGTLTATGKIFLINPNGVVFGKGSRVDTAGMIASTLNMADADFLAGRYTFYGNGGSVVNQGYLSSPGGYVALLGSTVENSGVIEANLGSIVLASGSAITLGLDPQGLINVVIDEATVSNLDAKADAVKNIGTLSADGGKVVLTAKALDGIFDRAINTEGIIEANTLDDRAGGVYLTANQRVNVAGEISAVGGTVSVDVQGADISAVINAEEAIFDMNDGDTIINGASYSGDGGNNGTYTPPGSLTLMDNLNIFVVGDLAIVGGALTLIADNDNNNSGDLWTFADISTTGGDVFLRGEDIHIDGLIQTSGGLVDVLAGRDAIHNASGDVLTLGGNFIGKAGRDYWVKRDAHIDTTGGPAEAAGIIDIFAGQNVILGSPSADHDGVVFWNYKSGSRGYKLIELGYYYGTPGDYTDVWFAQGTDIAGTIGADVLNQDTSGFLPYAKFNTGSEIYTWYTDASRNDDGYDHVLEPTPPDVEYRWEDWWNGGDEDFNDAIIDFVTMFNGDDPRPGSFLASPTDIFLTAQTGSITQYQVDPKSPLQTQGGTSIKDGTIIANNLMLSADTGITGVSAGDAIDTQVSNLSALNGNGDIRIRNIVDLTVEDLSAKTGLNPAGNPTVTGHNGVTNGSGTVEITVVDDPHLVVNTQVSTSNGDVILTADGNITHTSNGDVTVTNGNFFGNAALSYFLNPGSFISVTEGDARITAGDSIVADNSSVTTTVTGDGDTTIEMIADHITISNSSSVLAQVEGYGTALVFFNTLTDYVSSWADVPQFISDVLSGAVSPAGNINITGGSSVGAESQGTEEFELCGEECTLEGAYVGLIANNIYLNNGHVEAKVSHGEGDPEGIAGVGLLATNDISVDGLSSVRAVADYGLALVLLAAGGGGENNLNAFGLIEAVSGGFAGVGLLAKGDIHADDVQATGGDPDMLGWLINDCLLDGACDLTVDTGSYEYTSGILIASLAGDIFLGDIGADLVLAAAFGLDGQFLEPSTTAGEGNIFDSDGVVTANYLGLLARNQIGTPTARIATDVGVLSAYSWDVGNIFIDEATAIELGLYLPIMHPESFYAEFGASVAANNGIISVVSEGDMLVNSVVSPQGGVHLLSTGGSIYAGHGWCPAGFGEQGESFSQAFLPTDLLAGFFMMQGWPSGGPDYFSAAMASTPLTGLLGPEFVCEGYSELPPGPHVIAGGKSFFATPNGTIGVGDIPSPGGVPNAADYNPLHVCIQDIGGPPALPSGVSSEAGLTLWIGGTVQPHSYDDGFWGPIGIAGAVEGIVRPGVEADIIGVFPAPELLPATTSPLSPPGYVFYDDNDEFCCSPLDREGYVAPVRSARFDDYEELAQIWPPPYDIPPPPPQVDRIVIPEEPIGFRVYYEILSPSQFLNFEPPKAQSQKIGLYAYHPITEADFSAFDAITLDIGAYDFIDNNLNLKQTLSPFFMQPGEEEEEELQ